MRAQSRPPGAEGALIDGAPLGTGHHHIDIAAAAVRTHQSLTPVKNACLRAMPLGLFSGSGSN